MAHWTAMTAHHSRSPHAIQFKKTLSQWKRAANWPHTVYHLSDSESPANCTLPLSTTWVSRANLAYETDFNCFNSLRVMKLTNARLDTSHPVYENSSRLKWPQFATFTRLTRSLIIDSYSPSFHLSAILWISPLVILQKYSPVSSYQIQGLPIIVSWCTLIISPSSVISQQYDSTNCTNH